MGKRKGPSRKVVVLGGAVGLVVGVGLLLWGLAPAKEMMDAVGPAFNGGAPPEDLSERLDAAMAHLTSRAWADGVGFVLLLAGFVALKAGLAKPAPSVEELVQAEVARRLGVQSPTVSVSPVAQVPPPPLTQPTVSPAPAVQPAAVAAPSVRRTHCAACSSVLVAGGRICPQGHVQ